MTFLHHPWNCGESFCPIYCTDFFSTNDFENKLKLLKNIFIGRFAVLNGNLFRQVMQGVLEKDQGWHHNPLGDIIISIQFHFHVIVTHLLSLDFSQDSLHYLWCRLSLSMLKHPIRRFYSNLDFLLSQLPTKPVISCLPCG